jgi:hypothetical protein
MRKGQDPDFAARMAEVLCAICIVGRAEAEDHGEQPLTRFTGARVRAIAKRVCPMFF